jgi:hypothetical protein
MLKQRMRTSATVIELDTLALVELEMLVAHSMVSDTVDSIV